MPAEPTPYYTFIPRTARNNTMSTNDSRPLAEQAFDTYDKHGEEAMLAFILLHQNQTLHGDNLHPGTYILEDSTEIHWLGGKHPSYAARQVSQPEQRPATIPIDKQPGYISRTKPIMATPNSGDIMNEMMERAEAEARDQLSIEGQEDDQNVLNLYDLISLTPHLDSALPAAIAEQTNKPLPGRKMHDYLDALRSNCTDTVIASLPPSEFNALVDQAKSRLTQD